MSRSSFTRPVVITSCLVALSTLFAPPAIAQRKKAPGSSAAPAPKKKKAAVPAIPPPAEVAPAEAAPPVPEEAAPAPAPAAPDPTPPPPPVKRATPPPVVEPQPTTTDLGPPPARSVRKKRSAGGSRVSADVGAPEEEEDPPIVKRRKGASPPSARRSPRNGDVDAEAEEDRAEGQSDTDKGEDAEPEAQAADAEPEPDSDADTDVDAKKHARIKPPLLEIGAALRGFQRHFSYADDPRNELPNYDLGAAPAIGIDVGVYPFKNAKGSLSGGFVGSFEYAVALGTTYKVPTGEQAGTHSTTAYQYAIGVRGNYSFGAWLGNTISAGVDYGYQSFVVDHPPPIPGNANIPGVEYKFFRPNVMGRFVTTNTLSILGSLGYLSIASAGEIVSADYFRGATSTASGLDLGVGVAYEIKMNPKGTLKYLELRPMLTFRRYSFKFNPAEDDPYQSTGATDDYIGLNLGVATRL